MRSDCCGAIITHAGIMIANVTRTQFPEGDPRRHVSNDGIYCAACATPCLPVSDKAEPNSSQNFTETVTITNPRRGPGCTIYIPDSAAKELLIDSIVDEIGALLKKRLVQTWPIGVQYVYDTDTKKVLAKEI